MPPEWAATRARTTVSPAYRRWINPSWDFRVAPRRKSLWARLTPPQLFAGSFLLLIGLGTLALKLLPGLYTAEPLGWLDALFTCTSAVCVTGLIVVDTATFFTPRGQAVILVLIQLGGLGIITFTTLIGAAIGRRLSLRHETFAAMATDVAPHVDYRRLARDVVWFTLGFEALGALLLYGLWVPRLGFRGAAWPALFHSISAFCNAGFSTFSDSLIGFQRAPFTLLTIMALIVGGGLGFLTLEEIYLWRRERRAGRPFRVSLHSRLVLVTTGLLLAIGWVGAAWLEWDITLAGLPFADRLVNALFVSVTPRTAGFNNIDYARATVGTNFLTVMLMFIGGSPGSTAGGIKTTTAALIVILAWSRFRGQVIANVAGRSIPEESIQRAVGLSVSAFAVVTGCIFLLTTTELAGVAHHQVEDGFLKYMFEAVSAFNTVGLSMGVTAKLTSAGKWTIIQLMFLGRVGLPTVAAALTLSSPGLSSRFRYAYEDVVVG